MDEKCEKCGILSLECKCLNELIVVDIQTKITPICEQYSEFPNELIDVFEFFAKLVEFDQCPQKGAIKNE